MATTQERLTAVETRIEFFGSMVENINAKVNDLHDQAMRDKGAQGERGKWKSGLHSILVWLGPILGGVVGATFERKLHGG